VELVRPVGGGWSYSCYVGVRVKALNHIKCCCCVWDSLSPSLPLLLF
jgi:hypothetical protein